eukprot:COSAG03_NODE_475_length_7638_cov_21.601539_3_plen_87_part_00
MRAHSPRKVREAEFLRYRLSAAPVRPLGSVLFRSLPAQNWTLGGGSSERTGGCRTFALGGHQMTVHTQSTTSHCPLVLDSHSELDT